MKNGISKSGQGENSPGGISSTMSIRQLDWIGLDWGLSLLSRGVWITSQMVLGAFSIDLRSIFAQKKNIQSNEFKARGVKPAVRDHDSPSDSGNRWYFYGSVSDARPAPSSGDVVQLAADLGGRGFVPTWRGRSLASMFIRDRIRIRFRTRAGERDWNPSSRRGTQKKVKELVGGFRPDPLTHFPPNPPWEGVNVL